MVRTCTLLLCAVAALAQAPGDPGCSACHDQTKTIAGSPHAAVGCLNCHPKHQEYPHPAGIPKPACADCHESQSTGYKLGIHGRARAGGNQTAPDCGVCHGDVHQVQRTGTEAFRKTIPQTCGMCHSEVLSQYEQSVHGKAAAEGVVDAPVCSTCHGEHQIQPPSVSTSPVNPVHVPETCAQCHGDVRLTERFNLPREAVVSFESSFHGLALKGGMQTVANCASCHGVHLILPSTDPRSSIHPKNLPETCGRCHPGAGSRFALGRIHWVEGSEPPGVWWVRMAYSILIPLTIGGMFLHHAGDWVRKVVRMRLLGRLQPPPNPQASFRMYRAERAQHALLMLSFLVLVWTGFALKYPGQWWSAALTSWEYQAGVPIRGVIHRAAGALLLALSLGHGVALAVSPKLRRHWRSLWPRRGDGAEFIERLLYNLGFRARGQALSPHSYVEKAEYWAVVWGTAAMGITGVMLWANTFVLARFPKSFIDVASAIHFYEAVLASLAILVWHIYWVIFDPDVYPLDPSFLTGYSPRERKPETDAEPSAE